MRIGDTEASRYILASARRLDAASRRFERVADLVKELTSVTEKTPGPRVRAWLFELIGEVESAIILLARAIDMVVDAPRRFAGAPSIPNPVAKRHHALLEIRHAYEHIDERALGRIRSRPSPDALTIFDYRNLLERGRVSHGANSLRLDRDIPMLFPHGRKYIKGLTGRAQLLTPM